MQKIRQVKGKKKKTRVESDWKNYWGSSPNLLLDVEKLGKDSFTRHVLHLCKSKSMLSYLELREQIDRRSLESDDYYNEWIAVKTTKKWINIARDLVIKPLKNASQNLGSPISQPRITNGVGNIAV